MTPWITLDCDIDAHPKMAGLPSDAARYGWIRVLLEAKTQRRPGTFASAAHFRHVLGRHGRYLADYLKARLLEEIDGALLVHDWKRHQWAVAKGLQRETSDGHSEDIDETSVGPKVDASRAVSVTVPVSVSNGERVSGEGADSWAVYCGLTGAVRPSPNVVEWLNKLEDRFTGPTLVTAMGVEWTADQERRTFLSRVEHRLEQAARASELAVAADKRERRIQDQVIARRLEAYRLGGVWHEEWGPVPEGSAA